jgi:hypothetical protein
MFRIGRVAIAPLQRVSEHAGIGRGTGGVDPEAVAVLGQEARQCLLGHAGFDHHGTEPLVVIRDPIEVSQVHDHALAVGWRHRAVSPIASAADGIKGHGELIGDSDAGLNLPGACRPQEREHLRIGHRKCRPVRPSAGVFIVCDAVGPYGGAPSFQS